MQWLQLMVEKLKPQLARRPRERYGASSDAHLPREQQEIRRSVAGSLSMLITRQLPTTAWHEWLGKRTLAEGASAPPTSRQESILMLCSLAILPHFADSTRA